MTMENNHLHHHHHDLAVESNISAKYLFEDYWTEHGDPRISRHFLMRSFRPVVCIQLLYAIFVLWLGPYVMRRFVRRPLHLRTPMIAYNVAMSTLNAYFVIRILQLHNFALDMFDVRFPVFEQGSEQELHHHDHGNEKLQAIFRLHHLFVISKFFDLLDTVFFVLREKRQQITFLHVYHHFSVPLQAWSYFRLCGNSAIVIPFGLLNSFVHSLMYAYYAGAAMGPAVRPYLWWKRHLTALQIVQFVCICVYLVYFAAYQVGYPAYFFYNLLFQSLLYITLFAQFYIKNYYYGSDGKTKTVAKNLQCCEAGKRD